MMTLEEKTLEVLNNHLGLRAKATMESTFEELAIDSLDRMELIMAVEEAFNLELEEEELLLVKTVRELVVYLGTKSMISALEEDHGSQVEQLVELREALNDAEEEGEQEDSEEEYYEEDPTYVVFDIDGTLADISHRVEWVNGSLGFKNFDKFHDLMALDDPINVNVGICNILYESGLEILFITGRPESHREITLNWLWENGIEFAEDERLFMRPEDMRYKPGFTFKEKLLGELKEMGVEISLVYEDDSECVRMWRANNIICHQVSAGKDGIGE
jgi:acyl carrier protein